MLTPLPSEVTIRKQSPEQRLKQLTEILWGRIKVLQNEDPELAVEFLERFMRKNDVPVPKGNTMRKTYSIELKVDFDDEKRHAMALKLCRIAARRLLTQVALIADNRPPQIGILSEDFFEGGTVEGLSEIGEDEDAEQEIADAETQS